jgi:RimJ/RimL family protein N-acetyltransferase
MNLTSHEGGNVITIELKPFERDDFPRLIGWIKTPEFLLQWAGPIFNFPLSESELDIYLRGSQEDPPIRKIYKVMNTADRRVIGHIELNDIDLRNKSATVCRVLVGEPSLRKKGIGLQMLRKILEIGFNQLGLHRMDLVVFDFNQAAIKCYERAGFRMEGHIREARKIGSEYWSLYQMSILEHEWKAKKFESQENRTPH